ncbi:PAS domain-containing sensor histidine kinase [Marivita lacus]|uniref:PAS domain-containing sensor histidine kinase n=1 Tax=Marivita lacus TaxID=1323742 RepID=UPI001E49DF1C|nr:PAS domain-containing protein [Marivita lacus]
MLHRTGKDHLKEWAFAVLILILSRDLELRFVSHTESTPAFRPSTDTVGLPVEASKALIEADPDLPLDCRAALERGHVQTRSIGDPAGEGYLRRISVRKADDGRLEELVVSYEAGPLAPRTELSKVRRRLANAIEAIPDPVAYFDAEDRLVLCNTLYSNLHIGSGSEVVVVPGMRFEDVLRQDLANGALEMSEEAQTAWLSERLRKRRDPVFETEIRMRDRRWFRVVDRATEDGDRVNVLIDITSLKTAQRRLEEVELGSRVGLWSLDLVTGESSTNVYWAEMLGYDPDTMGTIGFEDWRALVHPDDVQKAVSGFNDCIAGTADRFEIEYRMRHRNGQWIWVLGRGGVADRDPEGRVRQIAGVLLDISARKALEAELGLRAAAVEASADAIMITDGSGCIIDANPALLSLFRAKNQTDLLGHPWHRLYDRSAAADLAAEAFPSLRSEQHWRGEVIATRLDGSLFEQALSMTEMPDGKIVHVSRDISAIKALARDQRALQEKVELAQRQEAINLLVAGLTHDFSNLLALILHLSDPASADAAVLATIDVRAEIHRAARQMVNLLEPLQGYVAGTSTLEEVDFVDIVRNATKLTALGAPRLLSVESDLPDQPMMTLVDPLRLTQVLLNLGLNARDAIGHEKGTIRFALSQGSEAPEGVTLDVGQVPDAPFAHLIISDTGPGIEADIREKIWMPYFTTKGGQGTGLGLALIAEIVRDVGGGIALQTMPRRGATFHILWPLTKSPAQAIAYAAGVQ